MDRKEYLERIGRVNREGTYRPDWDSLAAHPVPTWYAKTRLGIFLHWGVFSVPAYHDWYARNMYIQGSPEYEHHLKRYGPQRNFGYKDFIPGFTMEKFDPEAWVRLFIGAGADYIVPVAEHHDGFQLYRSELSHWNAADMGPRRDLLGDLLREAGRAGLTIGASSHRAEHWWFMGQGRAFDSDVREPLRPGDLYWPAKPEPDHQNLFGQPEPDDDFLTDWLLRCCEIVDRYRPRILYFDWWIQHSAVKPYLKRFTAYFYNRAESWGGCVINYKHDAFPFGCAVPDIERGQFGGARPFLWQSDSSVMRNSWCYSTLADYKTPGEIIRDLADVVSKNGRLLLNFGPGADGSFTEQDLGILRALGGWMARNGEAIHGAVPWRVAQEGPTVIPEGPFSDGAARRFTPEDFRFTCRGKGIYAIALACPEDGVLRIRSLRGAGAGEPPLFHGVVTDVRALGFEERPGWTRGADALAVRLGSIRSELPLVLKVSVD